MELFANLIKKIRKEGFKEVFQTIVFYFETGKGNVFGRFYGWWQEIAIILIFIKTVLGLDVNLIHVLYVSPLIFLVVTLTGRAYVKKKWLATERKLMTTQDPVIATIKQEIQSLREEFKNGNRARDK